MSITRTIATSTCLLLSLGLIACNSSTPTANHPQVNAMSSQATASLTNTYWKLTWLKDTPVEVFDNQREPHLVLHMDARLSGSDGCNRLMGSYQYRGEDALLQFSALGSTRMACRQGATQARAITELLHGNRIVNIEGNELLLRDEQQQLLARFHAVALR